jgi:hypothetical protein
VYSYNKQEEKIDITRKHTEQMKKEKIIIIWPVFGRKPSLDFIPRKNIQINNPRLFTLLYICNDDDVG